MINQSDILVYDSASLDDDVLKRIAENVRLACIGGVSRVREGFERKSSVLGDQIVGQFTTYYGSIALTGSPEGYFAAREKANANPHDGDGGMDIEGLANVDVKGSLMRRSQDPLTYRLLVRPEERHDGWVYVLALIPKKKPYLTYIVGGLPDNELPKLPYQGEIESLHGAFVRKAWDLRPINELHRFIRKC